MQVGLIRRGRYVKGKRVGKGNLVSDVRTPCLHLSNIRHHMLPLECSIGMAAFPDSDIQGRWM